MFRKALGLVILGLIPFSSWGESDSSVSLPKAVGNIETHVKESSEEDSRNKLEVSVGLMGQSLEDEIVNSKYAGGTLDIVGSRKISDQLSGRLDLTFKFTSGTYTNQYIEATGEEGKAPNVFGVNEAAVTYKPWAPVSLEAGVILTEFSSLPSTLDQLGFPALRETVELKNSDHHTHFFAMQALPTSETGAVTPASGGLVTQVHLVGASYTNDPEELRNTVVAASVTGFEFRNLNASAATDSQYLGNTVVAPGPQARFLYDFAGYEAAIGVKQRFGERAVGLKGSTLRNERAPAGENKAYLYSADYEDTWVGRKVVMSGGYFYNESDTLPSSYTNAGKGSNNRFGQMAKIEVEDKKENISGSVEYLRANEIVDRPYTADREILLLTLEAKYEIL